MTTKRKRAFLPPEAFAPVLRTQLVRGARERFEISIPSGLERRERQRAIAQLYTLVRRLNEYRQSVKHFLPNEAALLYRCIISTKSVHEGFIVLGPTDSDYGLLRVGGQPLAGEAALPPLPAAPQARLSSLPSESSPLPPIPFELADDFLASFDEMADEEGSGEARQI